MNNWYVITGGPAVGKTSLIAVLDKLGYVTVPEAARSVIDDALQKGISPQELREDEKKFQEDVTRLKQKNEAMLDKNITTFFDRGMQDSIAYLRNSGLVIEPWVNEVTEASVYQTVFLLEPLQRFETDYARTENQAFIDKIHDFLHNTYTEYGMTPVSVPPLPLQERINFILDYVKRG